MKPASPTRPLPSRARLRTALVTSALAVAYAGIMILTNSRFTLLDDESLIIAIAAHPVLPTLKLFLNGGWQHEHPPFSDVLLHGWLLLTHWSFFTLRLFANLFYIGSSVALAIAAGKSAGQKAYWAALLASFLWPFAFQYGRITGWYSVSMFLLSGATLAYTVLLTEHGRWPWFAFGILSVLLVWTNYFGVVLLVLFCANLLIFHFEVARRHFGKIATIGALVAISFIPLLRASLASLESAPTDPNDPFALKAALVSAAYSIYCTFASVAIAPWYLPLSVPIAIATVALLVSVWFSQGRRWLAYFFTCVLLLASTQHLTIKRITFLLPWFFLALGMGFANRNRRLAQVTAFGSMVIIAAGFIGIVSGKHYFAANFCEPWEHVARLVAQNARDGASVISNNEPFFLYLDEHLGLLSDLQIADGPDLGADLYRKHHYSIFDTDFPPPRANTLHGKVVIVIGSGTYDDVNAMDVLNREVADRCQTTGDFHAALDPALAWKKRFTRNVPLLAYRSHVIWYECP
jgi:hypothetical protein